MLTIVAGVVVYLLVSVVLLRKPVPDTVVGVLSAVQANAGNIGLPVAAYVLGDAQIVAPVMLVQVLFLTPVCLVVLDLSTQPSIRIGTILAQPFRNPAIIAALGGLVFGLTGIELPPAVLQPFTLVGGACVPLFLITFGMALRGRRMFVRGRAGREVALATAVKVALMPVVAFVLGRYAFGLDDAVLFPVLVVAALPTAQNVYNVAFRFGRGEATAISTIMLSTVLSVPVLLLAAGLLNA